MIKINRWDEWQTFRKDRGTPPWIKLYRNLLSNEEWVSLSDSEKGQLVSIWILAADKSGEIPENPLMIQRMAMLDTKPNINKFIELGFITSDCQPLDNQETTTCPQLDAPEKRRVETEKRQSREDSSQKLDYSIFINFSNQQISELKRIRKANKGGSITQRVADALAKEFNQANLRGFTTDQCLTEWELRGWKSFKSEWLKHNQKNGTLEYSEVTARNIETFKEWINE